MHSVALRCTGLLPEATLLWLKCFCTKVQRPIFATKAVEQPLHEACSSNSKSRAEELIAFGADVNARRKTGYSPIHVAAVSNASRDLL